MLSSMSLGEALDRGTCIVEGFFIQWISLEVVGLNPETTHSWGLEWGLPNSVFMSIFNFDDQDNMMLLDHWSALCCGFDQNKFNIKKFI